MFSSFEQCFLLLPLYKKKWCLSPPKKNSNESKIIWGKRSLVQNLHVRKLFIQIPLPALNALQILHNRLVYVVDSVLESLQHRLIVRKYHAQILHPVIRLPSINQVLFLSSVNLVFKVEVFVLQVGYFLSSRLHIPSVLESLQFMQDLFELV